MAMAEKSTSGGVDGWAWNVVKALALSWFLGLALVLRQIETAGRWPQGLLDEFFAMIPEAEGDSTLLDSAPLVFSPVVYRLCVWPIIQDWFYYWVPDSVFSAGKGASSVDAWYSTTTDIEEVLGNTCQGDFRVFVVDVVKSLDTVKRDILDCVLGRLGLPAWFRRVYFSFLKEVRLRFKLAAGLGVAWTRDGDTPQRCPLGMVFSVALYAPWCRHLEKASKVSLTSCMPREPQMHLL